MDASNLTEIRKETEAARLANRALANALAISEKDLAEAIEVTALMVTFFCKLITSVSLKHMFVSYKYSIGIKRR